VAIKAVVLDVDGVLTDGTVWWGSNGEESKGFSFRDIMGISQARKAGLLLALVSGERGTLIDRFAEKMGITDVYAGCKDKAAALRSFAASRDLRLDEVCFMGDDINDVPALRLAGLAATPADAHPAAQDAAGLVTQRRGGQGAVREVLDLLLSAASDHNSSADRSKEAN
jgi:3-deoxy-D-manno-octulosonate 8-phosphate phosphatase (KDO 8-P phosphatase)